jgi:hypothetical protein
LRLINLCGSQALDGWVREVVGEADGWPLVFGVFAETLTRHHDWHRGLGDQVVGEGAKNDAGVMLVSGFGSGDRS